MNEKKKAVPAENFTKADMVVDSFTATMIEKLKHSC